MDYAKMKADLVKQRDALNAAILAIDVLMAGGGKRRGRPPGSKNTKQPK